MKIIGELEKKNKKLEDDYERLGEHYRRKRNCIEKAEGSENKIIEIYTHLANNSPLQLKQQLLNQPIN